MICMRQKGKKKNLNGMIKRKYKFIIFETAFFISFIWILAPNFYYYIICFIIFIFFFFFSVFQFNLYFSWIIWVWLWMWMWMWLCVVRMCVFSVSFLSMNCVAWFWICLFVAFFFFAWMRSVRFYVNISSIDSFVEFLIKLIFFFIFSLFFLYTKSKRNYQKEKTNL